MRQPGHPKFRLVMCVLVLASTASIMSTDIYAPSLPDLPHLLGASASMVKLTIGLNVMMFGLGQMIHGPLSDRFGRRPVLLIAIALFTLSSFACALAQNIEQLILARMLQGFLGAAEAVICLAVFKDLFDERQQVRALAIFGMSIALGPAIAPIIGGYVHVYLGWRFNFHLIGVIGLLTTALIWKLLPESSSPDKSALAPRTVLANYRAVLANTRFVIYAGMVGVGMGIIYAFITGAPFILIDRLGVPTEHFGYYQAFIVAAYFIGSLVSMRAARYVDTGELLRFGIALTLLGGVCFIALSVSGAINAATFAVAFALMTFGLGPVFAVAPSKAMLSTDRSAGAAAAMLGAIEMGVGGAAAGAVGLLPSGVWPLGAAIGALMLALIALALLARRIEARAVA